MKAQQLPIFSKTARLFATRLQYSMLALALMNTGVSRLLAQDDHSHATQTEQAAQTPEQLANASALVKIVQDSTEKFKSVLLAQAAGYQLQFGCVAGDDFGAMGMHYVNGDLVNSGVLDATKPQIVIYEPTPNGGLKLIGVDYLLIAEAWDAKHSSPPELMGQMFHLFTAPNRFGLPAFYTLHVWAWKANPKGSFVNWHPNVSCEQYSGKQQ